MDTSRNPTTCRTPGAIYQTRVNRLGVQINVTAPAPFEIDRRRAEEIERALHDVIEDVLAPLWEGAALAALRG